MAVLLHIDASVDRKGSNTRRLSASFVRRWAAKHPDSRIMRRDLARKPAPPLDGPFVRAVKTPAMRRKHAEGRAWRRSQALAEEFMAADRYVIGLPMHILTAPSNFKAYIEQIFHDDRVFKTTPTGLQGLLGGRKFLFCLSKGADYRPGAPLAAFDMLEPYLIKLLTFCGVDEADIIFIALNNALGAGGADPDDEARAQERIAELADHW